MTDFKPTADYEVYRGDFSFCTGLSWVEVDKQIKFEKELGVIEALGVEENPTYLCTHQKTYPPGFFTRGLLMNKYHNVKIMHVYINKDPSSTTFVKHFFGSSSADTAANYMYNFNYAGYCNVTAAIDGVQFSFSS